MDWESESSVVEEIAKLEQAVETELKRLAESTEDYDERMLPMMVEIAELKNQLDWLRENRSDNSGTAEVREPRPLPLGHGAAGVALPLED